MLIFTYAFLIALLERALKTAGQAALGFLIGAQVTDAFAVDWRGVLGAAALGFVLSAITSVASAGIGPSESPSVTEDR